MFVKCLGLYDCLYVQMDPSERYCFNPTLHWNGEVEDYFVKAYGADHFARISKALTSVFISRPSLSLSLCISTDLTV